MIKFSWGNIKNGFRGFERLALEYVQSEFRYPGSSWEHTQETHDGNHDAVSLILGFQPDAMQEEWWMEAKYSNSESVKVLTRYRLDATIVSATLQKNVSKIVFVTNIRIKAKTIMDIRCALEETLHCGSVHFCTKDTLEYWLVRHPVYFSQFFPDTDLSTLALSPLFVTDGIEVYSDSKQGQSFCEALTCIYQEQKYYLYFSVFSATEQVLPIKLGDGISGVSLCTDQVLRLYPGDNQYTIQVFISSSFSKAYLLPNGHTTNRADRLSGPLLQIGSLDISPKHSLGVLPPSHIVLSLPSQQMVLNRLMDSLEDVQKRGVPALHCILGRSATGKTYIMENFSKKLHLGQNAFHISFSSDRLTNDRYICFLALFCLFPYLPPDQVDLDYFHNLQGVVFPNDILEQLIGHINEPEELHKLYTSAQGQEIFPQSMYINLRVILLDDLHKLDPASLDFLFSILSELVRKKQPVIVLMNATSNLFRKPAGGLLPGLELNRFDLTGEDVISALEQAHLLKFAIDPHLLKSVFPNVIELLAFLQYLDGQPIDNAEALITSCRFFSRSKSVQASIIGRFNNLFSVSPETRKLCMQAYWSIHGAVMHTPLANEEQKLLSSELVKIEPETNRLIPYHDIYCEVFRQAFPLTCSDVLDGEMDIYARMRNDLAVQGPEIAKNVVPILERWKQEEKHYSILYVLEGSFGTGWEAAEDMRRRWGEESYYKLLFLYGYAATNISRTTSGKAIFERIAYETAPSQNLNVQFVRMEALFELVNSNFEWLLFEKTKAHMVELDKVIHTLIGFHRLPKDINKCEKYILSKHIELLLLSEEEDPSAETFYQNLDKLTTQYHYDYERAFFRLRYAETLYWRKTQAALELACQSREELLALRGQEEKFYLWAKMDCTFLQFVLDDPLANLEEMQASFTAMRKEFYNDYRKRKLAMVCIYYQKGMLSAGDGLLFSDALTSRELRPRQKAFYYETMALYQALHGNTAEALEDLRVAEGLFSQFPSYLKIIEHNRALLEHGGFSGQKLAFCRNGEGADADFWIDPRCIW